MPSPFPGMDPYLEDPEIWSGFHADLAVEVKHRLNRLIGPKYYAEVEIQSVPQGLDIDIATEIRPDVSVFDNIDMAESVARLTPTLTIPAAPVIRAAPLPVRLRSVRVYRTKTREIVTAIEILSPYNKRLGSDGLREYKRKRAQILASRVHLVEIDLLRSGERPGPELEIDPLDTDYILLVNRAGAERVSEIWPVALNEPLPIIPIPLLPPDPDVPLDLNAAIRDVYTNSGFDWRITYQDPIPRPRLRQAMRSWIKRTLSNGKRNP